MTKKLEELLNLPENKEDAATSKPAPAISEDIDDTFRDMEEFDKIASALPKVTGLGNKADSELDHIAQRALDSFEDLMNLGMNVESRYSGRVFETAGGMLKTSLDAKTAKLDKKLKMIELQLKKQKADSDNGVNEDDPIVGSASVVTDRNSLLEKLRKIDK
jgi:hypothetical protein